MLIVWVATVCDLVINLTNHWTQVVFSGLSSLLLAENDPDESGERDTNHKLKDANKLHSATVDFMCVT